MSGSLKTMYNSIIDNYSCPGWGIHSDPRDSPPHLFQYIMCTMSEATFTLA
jgi:hypothetical protein